MSLVCKDVYCWKAREGDHLVLVATISKFPLQNVTVMCVLLNVKCTLLLQSSQTKTHVFIYLLMDFGLLNDECRRNFEITANWLARLRNSCPYSKRVIIDSSSHTRMKMAFRWRTRPTNPSKCLKCASIQRSHTQQGSCKKEDLSTALALVSCRD